MGSENKAAKEANKIEQERQARIASTVDAVNRAYDNPQRAAEIADYGDAVREFYTDDLNRAKAENDRELRFALARGGLTGGSTQVDQQRRFGEQYARGLLEVERRASGAMADLSAADQDARARLIGLANQGMDATTGASQAASAMRSTLESNKQQALMADMSSTFGQFNKFYEDSKAAAVRRRAVLDAEGTYGMGAQRGYSYGGGG